jgi:hypothetical protein
VAGVVSGSALLVDYVLTITISVASGADALFSVLPPTWQSWKLAFSCAGVGLLTLSFLMALITCGTGRASLLSSVGHLIRLATWLFLILAP